MTLGRLCGVLRRDGSDCPVPVAAGSPFNVCPRHIAAIFDYARDAASEAAPRRLRLDAPCPSCGVKAVVATYGSPIAVCASCGTAMPDAPPVPLGPTPSPAVSSVVYYLRVGDTIKIGYTANLQQRLAAYPPFAVLLATEPGGLDLERERHAQFRVEAFAGREWFRPSAALIEHINSLRDAPLTAADLAA